MGNKKAAASGTQTAGTKHSRPALTTLQLNGATTPKKTSSGSPPKRPRLSFD
jgi:hypothetical protein